MSADRCDREPCRDTDGYPYGRRRVRDTEGSKDDSSPVNGAFAFEPEPAAVMRDAAAASFSGCAQVSLVAQGAEASGGQGRVVKVRRADDGAEYALKRYANAEAAQREWKLLQLNRDDSTIPLAYAYGRVGGRPAIVMEFIHGRTLQAVIDERVRDGAAVPFSLEEAFRVLEPIVRFCAKTQKAREFKAHRDIKPANIMIAEGGQVKLVDFGMAALSSERNWRGGTPGYAAPELEDPCAQDSPDDARVDTYSLAATLYAMLSGRPPEAGAVQSAGQIAPFVRHVEDLGARVLRKVPEYMAETYGYEAEAGECERGFHVALESLDADFCAGMVRCLSARQADRPVPDALFYQFPQLQRQRFEHELFASTIIAVLNHGLRTRWDHAPSKAAETGSADMLQALDWYNGGYYDKAVSVFEREAHAGNVSAMYNLGVCIRDGLGPVAAYTDEDLVYLFSRSARAGNILAANALGRMLYEGRGVARNREKGIEWLRFSASSTRDGRTGFKPAADYLRERGIAPA